MRRVSRVARGVRELVLHNGENFCPFFHPSMSQPKGSEDQLEGSEGQLEGSKGQLEGS